MRQIILIAHNIRSCHNVGSLFRTAEGLGVSTLWLTGYTPYPALAIDNRLPHIAEKLAKQINKTALGAESLIEWKHKDNLSELVESLKHAGFVILGLEQTDEAIPLPNFALPQKLALIVGNEVEGMDDTALKLCDRHVVIPMLGKKESFNVVQAAAMALFHLRFSES